MCQHAAAHVIDKPLNLWVFRALPSIWPRFYFRPECNQARFEIFIYLIWQYCSVYRMALQFWQHHGHAAFFVVFHGSKGKSGSSSGRSSSPIHSNSSGRGCFGAYSTYVVALAKTPACSSQQESDCCLGSVRQSFPSWSAVVPMFIPVSRVLSDRLLRTRCGPCGKFPWTGFC